MVDEPKPTEYRGPKQKAIVEATDETGRLVDRTSFRTHAEAEVHAQAMRAKGNKVTVSSLDPCSAVEEDDLAARATDAEAELAEIRKDLINGPQDNPSPELTSRRSELIKELQTLRDMLDERRQR